MDKSIITLSALAIAALGLQPPAEGPLARLKEEKITVEYTPAANEAALIFEGESEDRLDRVEIRNPRGSPILRMRAQGGESLSVSGFIVETGESSLEALFRDYADGIYDIRAQTVDGRIALGSAELSHEVLPEPVMIYPFHGAVGVPTTDLTVSWTSNANAAGYRIVLEQNENDGLTAELPPGSDHFRVPDGILRANTRSHVEVGAIGPNGNITVVEVLFMTR